MISVQGICSTVFLNINYFTNIATETPKDLLLIDARSYGSAFLNRAKGGGVECQGDLKRQMLISCRRCRTTCIFNF